MPGPQRGQVIDPALLEDDAALDPSQIAQKADTRPAWQRALEGWWSNVNPMGIARMLTVDNPVTNWGAAVNSGMDLGYSHADLANRAIESAKRVGRGELSAIPETAGLAAAAAWPLQGGAMAHAGDRIASGDYAGGFGETAGLLTPFALSHAGPVVSKVGQVVKRGGQLAAEGHVPIPGTNIRLSLPQAGLAEAALRMDPKGLAVAGAPYAVQGTGWATEKAGGALTGLRNAATRMSERAQSALGLDPLAERLGFTQQTPVDPVALEAAHRARVPAPRRSATDLRASETAIERNARRSSEGIGKGRSEFPDQPEIPGFERYGGPEVQAPEGGAFQGEPAWPIEPTPVVEGAEGIGKGRAENPNEPAIEGFERFGGPRVEAPEGGAFQGESALPLQPTPLAETAGGVPPEVARLRKAGQPVPPETSVGQPQIDVVSGALEGLRNVADQEVALPPDVTITPASKGDFGYDSGQPAVSTQGPENFGPMEGRQRPREYTPPDQPLPQNAWSPEVGYSPELQPTTTSTVPKPRSGSLSFEGVDWNQTQPEVPTTTPTPPPSSVQGLVDVADTVPDVDLSTYPQTLEGHPYTPLNWEGMEPPLSPSLQALADAADGEGSRRLDVTDFETDPDFLKFSDDVDDVVGAARREGHADLPRQRETPSSRNARRNPSLTPEGDLPPRGTLPSTLPSTRPSWVADDALAALLNSPSFRNLKP